MTPEQLLERWPKSSSELLEEIVKSPLMLCKFVCWQLFSGRC